MPDQRAVSPTRILALLVAIWLVAVFPGADRADSAVLPSGFSDTLVAGVEGPTALAFTPDERLLIATQAGQLRVHQGAALRPTPALDLSSRLCSNSERGLLGVAVDPSFASNRFIYLFYTFKKSGTCDTNSATEPVNRVARFELGADSIVNPASERVLVDNMPSPNGNHNAGDVAFGKDGNLYISIGDGGCDYAGNSGCAGSNDAARDTHVLTGKVLRITRDGAIPPGNPFQGPTSGHCNVTGRTDPGKHCQETFAWGLRNPFRMGFDPNAAGTRFHINDVGQGQWEEIDAGTAGADYGWNVREGHCANGSTTNCGAPPAGMTNPIYDYGRATGCASITGGAFVPAGLWPADYEGAYLFSDYVCGKIFTLRPAAGGGWTRSDFVTGLGGSSAVHLAFGTAGPGRGLYYTTYAGGGQVRHIASTGTANRVPTAAVSASPTSGPAPLAVNFSGSGSTDPDGDTLTYLWDFGDGATNETAAATTSHTYAGAGRYTATLRVRDARGAVSQPVAATIDAGNNAPSATITSPAASTRFAVRQTITLSGSATDSEDGPLPDSALEWRVIRHHNTHTHPYLTAPGNNVTFAAPAPEDLAGAGNSYLEVVLTATDSDGITSTVAQDLLPAKVAVTFATQPPGLRVTVNELSLRGPATVTSWQGYALRLGAEAQSLSGRRFVFQRWSDGRPASHTVVTPASPRTHTANFRRS